MISVLNLRRRLNGNNPVFFMLLLMGLSLASCGAFKKASDKDTKSERTEPEEITGKKVYNPKTGRYEYPTEVTQEMDTIKWKDNTNTADPISSSNTSDRPGGNSDTGPGGEIGDPDTQRKAVYKVAVMLPFMTNKSSQGSGVDTRAKRSIQYYGGMKMAFDKLDRLGVRLDVSVLDTKASRSEVEALLKHPDVQQADVIIGPMRKDNAKIVATYGKRHKKPVISPTNPSTDVSKNNAYYVQVNPSLQAHCEAITKHVKDRYKTEQVVLVSRHKKAEVNRLKYFQNANHVLQGSTSVSRFKEYVVTDQTADYREIDVTPYILDGETTVFVVPSWSNESFIYSLLRKISIAKGKNKVVVYGMPQWMNYERISYDYYENLNVHISSANYVDLNKTEIKNFKQDYFNRYGEIPDLEAFAGYDMMLYFGRMLQTFGNQFQHSIDGEKATGLQTRFEFDPVASSDPVIGDQLKTERYENRFVYILKFEDYYFQPAK